MPLGGYRAAVVATLGARDTVPVLRCWDVLIRQVEGERGGESAILGGRRPGDVLEQVEQHEVLVARWRAIERLEPGAWPRGDPPPVAALALPPAPARLCHPRPGSQS